jgi:nitrite reductase/ring-hydroxylating ferredoxin subunit
MAWHAVAKADDVEDGNVLAASVADNMIALYRIDETFYATSDICTHAFPARLARYSFLPLRTERHLINGGRLSGGIRSDADSRRLAMRDDCH